MRLSRSHKKACGLAPVQSLAASDKDFITGQGVYRTHRKSPVPEHLDKLIRGKRGAAEPDNPRHLLQRNMRISRRCQSNFGADRDGPLGVTAALVLGDAGG